MRINSDYYGETLEVSSNDLEPIFDLYEQWCNDNFQNTECSKEEFTRNPFLYFDHIAFHAEIVNSRRVNDFIDKNRVI